MFLKLVGQTMDTQNLRDITKLLGYTIAARTGREEESREAIGIPGRRNCPSGRGGHRISAGRAQEPRKFRYFFTSADFVPG